MPATIEEVRKLAKEQQAENRAAVASGKITNPNEERFAKINEAVIEAKREGYKPGERMALMTIALAAADGDPDKAMRTIADSYGQRAMVEAIERTMSQQNPQEGGYLVPERWSDEIIPFTRDSALLVSLGIRVLENPTGDLSMARVSAVANTYWKAPEGGKIKTSKPKFGRLRLRDKACASIVPVTNKLMRNGGASLENFIETDLRAAVAVGIDTAGWFGSGGEDEPTGLFNTKIIDAAGVNKVSLSTFDGNSLVKMMLKHMEAKGSMVNFQWAMGPAVWAKLMTIENTGGTRYIYRDEMASGTLMGIPYKYGTIIPRVSTNVGYLALADWNEYILAPSRPIELAKSNEAAYYDEDGNITAAFGNDETVIRVLWGGDMGPRRLQSFTLSNDVNITGV